MEYPTPLLRRLLAVAKKLRTVAAEALTSEADRDLFLSAAAALETRANWLAYAPSGTAQPMHLHQPVNLLI